MGNHQRLLFLLLICSFNQLLFRTLPFMTLAQKISEEEPLQEGSGGLNPDDEDYADHESSGNLPADGTHEDVGHVPVITHSPITTTTKSIKTTTSSKSKYLTPPPRFDEDVEVDEKGVYGRKTTTTTTTKIPPMRDDTEFNMIYIIIGIVGFLLLLLALIMVFMCCCRKPKENNDYTQGIVRTKDYV